MDCFGRPPTDGLPRNDKFKIAGGSRMAASSKRIQIVKLICRHPASYTRINNLSLRATKEQSNLFHSCYFYV